MPEDKEIEQAFKAAVNMTPAQLRKWLATDESRSVGMTHDGERVTDPSDREAVGHQMGRRILNLMATKAGARTADDVDAMRTVVNYVNRHGKQRPNGDVTETRWRKSLMNWGHDPLL